MDGDLVGHRPGGRTAASVPTASAARRSNSLTVGSSRYTSSPTSASRAASRIASEGVVTVSDRRSMVSPSICIRCRRFGGRPEIGRARGRFVRFRHEARALAPVAVEGGFRVRSLLNRRGRSAAWYGKPRPTTQPTPPRRTTPSSARSTLERGREAPPACSGGTNR